MHTLKFSLSDDQLNRLRIRSEQAGITPEELLQQLVDEFLGRNDERFLEAANLVLMKNEGLYRR